MPLDSKPLGRMYIERVKLYREFGAKRGWAVGGHMTQERHRYEVALTSRPHSHRLKMEISDLIPVAALVASIIAASAVARFQIKKLEVDSDKLEGLIEDQDIRLDKLMTATEVLSEILSPSNLEIRTRQIETIRTDVEWIKRKLESK
jgi:hypothetical protein